jgi:hypothetical protein
MFLGVLPPNIYSRDISDGMEYVTRLATNMQFIDTALCTNVMLDIYLGVTLPDAFVPLLGDQVAITQTVSEETRAILRKPPHNYKLEETTEGGIRRLGNFLVFEVNKKRVEWAALRLSQIVAAGPKQFEGLEHWETYEVGNTNWLNDFGILVETALLSNGGDPITLVTADLKLSSAIQANIEGLKVSSSLRFVVCLISCWFV